MSATIKIPKTVYPDETTELAEGYSVKFLQDPDPENPRSWDNCWTILTAPDSRRIAIDDELDMDGDERVREAALVANVFKYEHGLISYTACAPAVNCPWDSGQVGFAVLTAEELEEYFGGDHDKAKACLDAELETYTDWCNGSIYGIITIGPEGEIDSCWGIYPEDHNLAWAVRDHSVPAIEYDIEQRTTILAGLGHN